MKKLAEILLLCAAVALLMGADSANARFHNLGSKIMCTCGDCTYMLLECNHVGCPNSERMIHQLRALTGDTTGSATHPVSGQDAGLALEKDDEKVLEWFRSNWGVTAVVEPSRHGLELWAWILPPAVLVLGFGLVLFVIRSWRLRPSTAGQQNAKLDPHFEALRDRARRETEI
jgi:cytochrome c-type biogenesis protein CcmH